MACLVNRSADQGGEEPMDFVAGQRDQVVGTWAETVLVGPDDGQEGVGEPGTSLRPANRDPATRTGAFRGTGLGE